MSHQIHADGLTPQQRYKQKPADLVVCPTCLQQWQRTVQQRSDGTRCCSPLCAARAGNAGRMLRTHRSAATRYRALVAQRLGMTDQQARDVDVRDIVLLMLDARRDGIRAGVQRVVLRRARAGKE